jgi:hypothetical protein
VDLVQPFRVAVGARGRLCGVPPHPPPVSRKVRSGLGLGVDWRLGLHCLWCRGAAGFGRVDVLEGGGCRLGGDLG